MDTNVLIAAIGTLFTALAANWGITIAWVRDLLEKEWKRSEKALEQQRTDCDVRVERLEARVDEQTQTINRQSEAILEQLSKQQETIAIMQQMMRERENG